MSALGALTAPILLCAALIAAACRGVDAYDALRAGARKGLQTALEILPALVTLFPAVYLLRASGLPEQLGRLLSPLLQALGVPPETGLILLLRPLSGSGAMAEAARIMETGLPLRRGGEAQPLGHPRGPLRGPGLLPLLRLGLQDAVGVK